MRNSKKILNNVKKIFLQPEEKEETAKGINEGSVGNR